MQVMEKLLLYSYKKDGLEKKQNVNHIKLFGSFANINILKSEKISQITYRYRKIFL